MTKYELKTKKNAGSVSEYIKNIANESLRKDGKELLRLFKVVK